MDVSVGEDRLSLLALSLASAAVVAGVPVLTAAALASAALPPCVCGGAPPLLLPGIVAGGDWRCRWCCFSDATAAPSLLPVPLSCGETASSFAVASSFALLPGPEAPVVASIESFASFTTPAAVDPTVSVVSMLREPGRESDILPLVSGCSAPPGAVAAAAFRSTGEDELRRFVITLPPASSSCCAAALLPPVVLMTRLFAIASPPSGGGAAGMLEAIDATTAAAGGERDLEPPLVADGSFGVFEAILLVLPLLLLLLLPLLLILTTFAVVPVPLARQKVLHRAVQQCGAYWRRYDEQQRAADRLQPQPRPPAQHDADDERLPQPPPQPLPDSATRQHWRAE
uniref:Uncharacterized protein n=1 Tax=Anopheles albimanus TaxID=7167 RepID=A0A182FXG5_ANOAL